jgi:hypothetical protein
MLETEVCPNIKALEKSENAQLQKNVPSHLGIEPRTFGLEVQRAILCANGTLVKKV